MLHGGLAANAARGRGNSGGEHATSAAGERCLEVLPQMRPAVNVAGDESGRFPVKPGMTKQIQPGMTKRNKPGMTEKNSRE